MVGAFAFTLKWGTPFHTAKAAGWDFNILRLGLALAIALMDLESGRCEICYSA